VQRGIFEKSSSGTTAARFRDEDSAQGAATLVLEEDARDFSTGVGNSALIDATKISAAPRCVSSGPPGGEKNNNNEIPVLPRLVHLGRGMPCHGRSCLDDNS
jgi:hypothetical protein